MSYDVAILGAGAAGTAAAILLRGRGLNPVLIESPGGRGRGLRRPDWLSAAANNLLAECRIDCSDCLGKPFEGIAFHTADLKKTARADATKAPAYRVDYSGVVGRMHTIARKEKVEMVCGCAPTRIDLGEKRVRLELEGHDPIEAGFLVLADGAARTFATAGPGQPQPLAAPPSTRVSGRWVATLQWSGTAKGRQAGTAADAHMHWVCDLNRQGAMMLWWWDGPAAVLNLLSSGTGQEVASLLQSVAGRLMETGLIPGGKRVDASSIVLRPAPFRSALEMESHVDKRCLLIGDAGGFVSETSGEGLYP
ncbi:MAG: FAD-dependent oxidoreductase, partial [Planctomycetes bacterium]|nr:FAD-dependent oxidoreductase [Planctomycetota bacterium]